MVNHALEKRQIRRSCWLDAWSTLAESTHYAIHASRLGNRGHDIQTLFNSRLLATLVVAETGT